MNVVDTTRSLWGSNSKQSALSRWALPAMLLACLPFTGGASTEVPVGLTASPSEPDDALAEIIIQAPEPRFVAPTRRDQIGRIWAPVLINGKGPFRLVLDTGASRSGIAESVAQSLGITPDILHTVLLRGVAGAVRVPTVQAERFSVGDLSMDPVTLPILIDPLGGAEGVLGTEAFHDQRVYIDFRHDLIHIARSKGERGRGGFVVIPFEVSAGGLLVIHAQVAGTDVQAVIDTGAQITIGNQALRAATVQRRAKGASSPVIDVTSTSWKAEAFSSPPIELGPLQIRSTQIVYADLPIFEHWHMVQQPALLIGMDVLGLLDVLIIDYRRSELQLRTPYTRGAESVVRVSGR
jgi:predicted aspartyl protease